MRQRKLATIRANGHYLLSGVLLLAIFPALKAVHLPAAVDWERLIPLYWVGFALRSIFAAVVLGVIGLPASVTVAPVWAHFARQKARLLIFIPFVFWAFWQFGVYIALIWIVVALVSTELLDRTYEDRRTLSKSVGQIILPALYLFIGLILVSAYNDVIVARENPAAYDWLFLKADSYLLHGHAISAIAQSISARFSARSFALVDGYYYRMFDQVGAAVLIISACQGMKRGLRLVGTLLTAYYIALLIFYLWPSMGPFYTCADHFSHFPHWLETYANQRAIIANAKILSSQFRSQNRIGTDYFIAFPSLHVALPIVVLWFMRPWRRIFYILVVYDIVLVPVILLLEWHYVVDLLGGVLLAAAAIFVNNVAEPVLRTPVPLTRASAHISEPDPVYAD